jgi:hypothetical protein
MYAELARFVGSGGNDSAFVALTTDDDGLPFQRGFVEFFDGDKEGVHIHVENGAGKSGSGRDRGHADGILAAGAEGKLGGVQFGWREANETQC